MKYIHSLYIIIIFAVTALLAGCRDDELGDFGPIGEGEARVSIRLSWDRGDEVNLDSRAGGDDGNIIQEIETLYMFIYDTNGNLVKKYDVKDADGNHDEALKNVTIDQGDNRVDGEEGLGDKLQGRAQWDMTLDRGEYYIYAVANVDINAPEFNYGTRDELKANKFEWDTTHTEKNNQMFGIFSLNDPNRNATDSAPLRINAKSVLIHSWVRRLASKVTVAFDGTELYDNVQVYIETITIHDIPKECTLGNENHPGGSELASKDRYSVLHKTGKTITIQEIPEGKYITPAAFLHVCNSSHPYLGKGDESTPESVKDKMHEHESESLFFYENMQGSGKSKKQSQDGTHIDFDQPKEDDITSGWKDNKAFGTYIEVTGYYRCVTADGTMGSGPIKYRYMLGKGDTDYNAERNTHYKLTLKLKGYGNDYDWHIDYQTTPGLHVTSPLYISYLYNKRMNATVKMVGAIPDGYQLRARIIECSWEPYGDNTPDFPLVKDVTGYDGKVRPFYYKGDVSDDGPWNSFLSLRQTNTVKVEVPGFEGGASQSVPDSYISSSDHYIRQDYESAAKGNQGERFYDITEGQHSSNVEREGVYSVAYTKRTSNGTATERVFTIPIFTRAKELVTKSGFTGNNPYYSYPRHGKIEFAIVNPETDEIYGEPVYLDMIQVRRILNPKGVWRKSGSNDKFHVRLMRLENLDDSEFKPFKSIGKWSAEIVTQSDNIVTISTTTDGSGDNAPQNGSRIEGEDEHYIDFDINFNGNSGCAIVKVRYHNYTCEHEIFVREGYDPIDVSGKGDQLWTSFNIDHFEKVGNEYKAVPVTSPIAEGSLFRRTSYVAILQSNNDRYPRCVRPPSGSKFAVHDPDSNTTEMTWSEIINNKKGSYDKWEIAAENENEHIATSDDVYNNHLISSSSNDSSFPIAKAYGIVYADGATETLTNVKKATGYNGTDSNCGMMGVIVYNRNTCNQIFLPIGTEWHGHRKNGGGWKNNDTDGTLRYGGRSDVWGFYTADLETLKTRPLFYDLYERPGAIYWFRDRISPLPTHPIPGGSGTYNDGTKSCALDMNFYTMSFEGYMNDAATSDNGSDSHACFIRTVISNY